MADKVDKKTAEEISNLRKIEAEITKELIALRERLKILSSEDVVNLKEASQIQFQLLDLEKQKRGITKEIVDINGKVLESDEKREEISQSILDLQEDSLDRTQEMLKSNKQLEKEAEKIKIQQSEILNIEKELNRYEVEIQKNKESVESKGKELLKNSSAQIKLEEYINNTLQSRQDALAQAATQNASQRLENLKFIKLDYQTSVLLSEVQEDMADATQAAVKGSYKQLDTKREEIGIRNIEMDIMDATAKRDMEAVKFYQKQKEGLDAIISAKQESNALNEKEATKQQEIIKKTQEMKELVDSTGFNKVFDGVEGSVKKIPGGGALIKTLGFDKFKENITKNLGGALTNVMTGFQAGGLAGFKALGLAAKQFGMALLAGPQAVIFGILAAVGLIIAAFAGVDKEVSEVQKSMGGNKKEARETYELAKKMSGEMKLTGLNAGELAKSMATVSESMGGLDVASIAKGTGAASQKMKQLVQDTAVLTEKFGMSAEEVDNIKTLSAITGKSIGDLTNSTVKMGKGLMTDRAAMKALASVPKEVAVAFKGGSDALVKAAQKAKLLGTDLKKVQEIGDGLLDIETSLAKEMEARVLTGKNLNLDKAREYALSGEIGKLQDTLLEEAGSLQEFTEMNRIQQKSMAEAMGMSVEEMTTMLTKAQELKDVGLSSEMLEQKHLQNAEGLRKEAEAQLALGKKGAADKLLALAAEKDSATFAEKLGDVMKKIQQSAEKLITPLVDMVHAMFDAESGGSSLIDTFDGIMSAIKPVFTILIGIGKLIFKSFMFPLKLVFALIQPIIDAIQEVFSVMDTGEKSGAGLSAIFDGIGKVMDFIQGTVIEIGKGLITSLITPAKLFWKAVISPIWDVFKGISETISKAFTPLQSATETGSKFGGIMDGVKALFERLQPAINAIGKYLLSFILKPITLITEGIGFVVKLFTGDFKGAAQSAGNLLVEYFLGVPKKILGMVTGVIDALFGTNLTAGLDEVFKWIKETVGNIIFGVGGKIIDFIMAPFNILKDLFGGIIKMFTGDFEGGLKQIGDSIIDNVINIFLGIPKLIWGSIATVIDAVFGTKLTEQVDGFFNNITDVFKKIGGFIMDIGGSILKFIMRPFDLAKGLIDGIIKMFTGDFKGGIETIGKAILDFIMAPFNLVQDLFDKFTGMFSGLGDTIKDAAKGMLDFLPDSLNPFAGGGDEAAKGAEGEKKIGAAATGGTITKGGATLVGEKGPEVVSLPQGSVVASASATKQIGSAMDSMGGATTAAGGTDSQLAVLQSIDAKIGALLEPIQKVGETISSIVGSISSMATSLPGIGGVVSGISSLFGGGGGEKSTPAAVQATSIPQSAASPATGMSSSPMANSAATAGKEGKGGQDPVVEKLEKLIGIMSSITSQPTIIKIGDKTVEEIQSKIDVRKTYNVAIDNTYGRRV